MHKIFSFFLISLLYLEGVYHLSIFGFTAFNPLLAIAAALVVAAVEAGLVGCFKQRKFNMIVTWVFMVINYLVFASQIVYYQIFTRPLLIEIALTTGGEALTDFWGVALDGILKSIIPLIFSMVPFAVAAIGLKKDFFTLKRYRTFARIEALCIAIAGISLSAIILVVNYNMDTEFYEEYQGMYAPEKIAEQHGILALFERQFLGDLLVEKEEDLGDWSDVFPPADEPDSTTPSEQPNGTEGEGDTSGTESTEDPGPTVDTSPNVLNIDFDKLLNSKDEDIAELAEMMMAMTPSKKNEYTGMFEGYNLIYLTAEGFSPYAVSEELTPTLYKMLNSGVVAKNYYIPLWATSTSDGEYVNLFGQIPDGQNSFKKTAGYDSDSKKYGKPNENPYSLPAYFAEEGVKSFAYHNNSLSYYDRHLTHPNLGYDYKAARLGACSSDKYGDKIFEMHNAKAWPASDYDMMVATIPEYINEDRFHAYYMTVSGHANYSFAGNRQAANNKDVVANLDCSEQMKAYIACNYELEKAMAYLVDELEKAGKLDNTVIVLSADHYPYGLDDPRKTLEEFSGKDLTGLELEQNCLIMWNSKMETINVEKTCSALDIMPTLLNLFGFDYDSRLFAGRDILSDSASFVVFSNRSFITDIAKYDASTKKVTALTDAEVSDDYISSMKSYVKAMFKYSAGILNDDFHAAVRDAQIIEDKPEEPASTENTTP